MRRRDLLLGAGALALAPTATLAAPKDAQAIVARLRPFGRFGYLLVDLDTGAVVEALNEDELFIPASLTKIATAHTALDALGEQGRFATRVIATGPVEDGIVRGDLVLQGGGDPVLDTKHLAGIADGLAGAGLRGVEGRFLHYGGALPETGWIDRTQPWQAPYNPSVGGLNLNFNRVQFRWSRRQGGLSVLGAAAAEGVTAPAPSVSFRVRPGASDMSHAFTDEGESWSLGMRLLRGSGRRWLPVRRPSEYVAGVLHALAAQRGIALPMPEAADGPAYGDALIEHFSPYVTEMVEGMLRYSTNLTAEALGAATGYVSGGRPADIAQAAQQTAERSTQVIGEIGGRSWQGMTLMNHSGLTSRSRMTPRQVVAFLRHGDLAYGPRFAELHHEQPLSARQMGRRGRAPTHMIRAKTGTMHFVRGYAGFLEVPGRRFAFAFMASEDDHRAAMDRAFRPYHEGAPKHARGWLGRTHLFERAMLTRWIEAYSA